MVGLAREDQGLDAVRARLCTCADGPVPLDKRSRGLERDAELCSTPTCQGGFACRVHRKSELPGVLRWDCDGVPNSSWKAADSSGHDPRTGSSLSKSAFPFRDPGSGLRGACRFILPSLGGGLSNSTATLRGEVTSGWRVSRALDDSGQCLADRQRWG